MIPIIRTVARLTKQKWYARHLYARAKHSFVDCRSDTLTKPSKAMLSTALTAPLGDDVFSEDPTVNKLQEMTANLFEKEDALWCPSGTMTNLVAIMAHCHERATEIIVGKESHLTLWEGGNVATIAGVHPRQILENSFGKFDLEDVRDVWRLDDDDHFAKTALVCIENSHNMMGGSALEKAYIDELGTLTKELDIGMHIDGARIFNAAISLDTPVSELCESADSVSVCLSKGLGAPMGSVLVGTKEFIRLARRARKRLGGGTRQAGVIAAMNIYAIENNVERLADDHERAKRIAIALKDNGFYQPQNGNVQTNIVYFGLPKECRVSKEEFTRILKDEFGVLVGYGYSRGGELFRVCTHIDVDDKDVEHLIQSILTVQSR
eukprot:scaffold840_cov257-Chaetoceros_neogracile.AAC.9